TLLSIVAGLSSTVVVPVVSVLMAWYGWRTALIALALMQFFGPACINAWVLRGTVGSRTAEFARRKASADAGRPSGLASMNISPLRSAMRRSAFWALAIAASVHWFVITAMNVHIMPLLQQRGVSTEMAVLIFSINGPAAVAARLALHMFDRNGTGCKQGRIFFPLFAVGMAMLVTIGYLGTAGLIFYSIVFGMAAGVLMIVRQTAIAEIFGLRGYGAIAGALATVSILPRTSAPFAVALMVEYFGSYDPVIWVLTGLIILGSAAFYYASSERAGRQ
ncbi:MAG: MFS transporter, partial [Alphaproteobacteria bacterium]|nr:MFS transporter [Alphaproteobacteria bacterium]